MIMERIDHSFHPLHPLFRRKWLFGKSYWCASCHQHFCCGESFYCSICDFAMDSNCALMKPIECKGEPNIQHFSHQHPMPLIESFFKNEVCFACQSSCLGSPTYICTKCKYFLHKRCAECPQANLTHPSHKRHHLHLCVDHERKITCKSCKRNVCSFILSCSECNWNLCIECYLLPKHVNQYYFHFHHHDHSNLTLSLSTNSAEFTCNLCHLSFEKGASRFECTICGFVVDVDCAMRPSITVEGPSHFRHFYHQHPMMLVVDDARDRGGTDECCFACHSPCILGVAYFSCTECKYFIHKSCAELPLKIRHALHIDHPLILASRHTELFTNSVNSGNLPIFHHCSTCQRKINPNGFFFLCCDHSCKRVWICVKCIFENPIINYEGHGQHRLCYVKEIPQILECNAYDGYCKLPATSVELCSTEYSMFRCVHCDFNLHLLCGPLPCTIKYKYHVHPLMLVDSVVENNSDEHSCDVCESERDSRICVYYCQECKFVAHVYCLIPEIINELRGGNVELRTVKINDHRKKKVSSSTLKFCNIVNHLPKDEKVLFQTHFDMVYFDRHSSTELTRFTRENFERLIDWLNEYYCFKKQELEYPKSRMEFVTAEGYTIPKNLARILVLVLRKYGDISRQSESTPEIKSIAFSFLCEVLNSMSKTKVTYITQYDLKEWYFYVNFARRRGFSVEFISEKLKDVVRAFLGLQAAAERSSEPDRFKRDLTRDILELQKELDDLKSESSSSFINWGEFTMECLDVALKLIEEDHVAGNLLQL